MEFSWLDFGVKFVLVLMSIGVFIMLIETIKMIKDDWSQNK